MYVDNAERAKNIGNGGHIQNNWGSELSGHASRKAVDCLEGNRNGSTSWGPDESASLDLNGHRVEGKGSQHARGNQASLYGQHESYSTQFDNVSGDVSWSPAGAVNINSKNDLEPERCERTNVRSFDMHRAVGSVQEATPTWEPAESHESTFLKPSGLLATKSRPGEVVQDSVMSPLIEEERIVSQQQQQQQQQREEFINRWRRKFGGLLSTEYDSTRKLNGRVGRSFRKHKSHVHPQVLEKIWDTITPLDNSALEKFWNELPQTIQALLWPGLMLKSFQHRPSQALQLLEIKYASLLPPTHAISDSLDYLISLYLSESRDTPGLDDARNVDKGIISHDLRKIVIKWMSIEKSVRIQQKSIWLLLSNLDDKKLHAFYRELRRLGHSMSRDTSIHFASRFAKSDLDLVDLSFKILQRLPGRGAMFDQSQVMSLCTSILHKSRETPEVKSSIAEKLQFMTNHGMKVNVIHYNVLIQNAILSGDSETAWGIHDMMLERHIEPDEYTYSILLNDAKWRMDSVAIRSVMGHVAEKNIGSSYIATDLIHLIFLLQKNDEKASEETSEYERRLGRKAGFERMLGKYSEHFYLSPLKQFIPDFERWHPQAANPSSMYLVDPAVRTISVMLTGLLHSSDAVTTKGLYDRFIHLISYNSPLALSAASDPYIWNIFLHALGRFPIHLNECPNIIKTMITLREKSKSDPRTPKHHITAEPTQSTWSALLQIFTNNNQLRAAEKLITAMKSRGTEPDEVTWTTLAWGYSKSQDVEKMADTICRMEMAGVTVSDKAVAAMARIGDRKGLVSALTRRRAQSERKEL